MSEPTNDELNRWAHAYLGRGIWCNYIPESAFDDCAICGQEAAEHHQVPPDYCTDLNAARELVEAVVDKVGHKKFAFALVRQMFNFDSLIFAFAGISDKQVTECILAPARVQVEAAMKAAGGME